MNKNQAIILVTVGLVLALALYVWSSQKNEKFEDSRATTTPESLLPGPGLRRVSEAREDRRPPVIEKKYTTDDISNAEIIAGSLIGIPVPRGTAISTYANELSMRSLAGESAAKYALAALTKNCKLYRSDQEAAQNIDHPFHTLARECEKVPDLTALDIYKMIDDAAEGGDVNATLDQLSFPPPMEYYGPEDVESRRWRANVTARLQVLVDSNNYDAAYVLANAYRSGALGAQDEEAAMHLLERFMELSPSGDPRRSAVSTLISRMQSVRSRQP